MQNLENKFARVNSTYSTGFEYFKRTIKVYEALKQEKEPVRPIELAKHMNLIAWGSTPDYWMVIHPLHWLEEMGMARREEHEEIIEIDLCCSGHYETVTKVIDGLEYKAQKWVEGSPKKVVKYYKWYVV